MKFSFDALTRESEAIGTFKPGGRVSLDGAQSMGLPSSTVQTFAIAIHELATDAVAYVAPSTGRASNCDGLSRRMRPAGPACAWTGTRRA